MLNYTKNILSGEAQKRPEALHNAAGLEQKSVQKLPVDARCRACPEKAPVSMSQGLRKGPTDTNPLGGNWFHSI